MRRSIILAALFVSACATTPEPQPTTSQPTGGTPQQRSGLIGLTPNDLIHRFGTPTLQVREGAGLKLQFRTDTCVLDAYLYVAPNGQGAARVTHVDARLRSGADTSQASCIDALSRS